MDSPWLHGLVSSRCLSFVRESGCPAFLPVCDCSSLMRPERWWKDEVECAESLDVVRRQPPSTWQAIMVRIYSVPASCLILMKYCLISETQHFRRHPCSQAYPRWNVYFGGQRQRGLYAIDVGTIKFYLVRGAWERENTTHRVALCVSTGLIALKRRSSIPWIRKNGHDLLWCWCIEWTDQKGWPEWQNQRWSRSRYRGRIGPVRRVESVLNFKHA